MSNEFMFGLIYLQLSQPSPSQAKAKPKAGLDLVMPLRWCLRWWWFTPKLPIGPIQTSSNLIGQFQKSTKLELNTNLSKPTSLNWNHWSFSALSYFCNSPAKPKSKPKVNLNLNLKSNLTKPNSTGLWPSWN